MDDLLKQFLLDGEKLMENVPLDFFANYQTSEAEKSNGIHIVWFIEWARENKLLSADFRTAIDNFVTSNTGETKSLRDFCDEYTHGSLKPEQFSEDGKAFARAYYTTGWEHRYLIDLEKLFPGIDSFAELVDTPENYKSVSKIIGERFAEFQ